MLFLPGTGSSYFPHNKQHSHSLKSLDQVFHTTYSMDFLITIPVLTVCKILKDKLDT